MNEDEDEDENNYSDIYVEEKDEYYKQKEEEDISEMSSQIRENIFYYVNENGYNLCEYLDIKNMEIFVKWLVSK
jgi:hypothetical protein